ncbi:hypothetical protein B1B_04121 [mine drainage metagenome]|uniref:Transposase n=1 Tax=mine drainage metagenome TaxID=410659 RepID=T1BGA3_9ZZZZ
MRKAFMIPANGNLSDDMPYADSDVQAHEKCNLIIEHLKVYLHTGILMHMNIAAKTVMERYRKRENMLFVNNSDHTIPRTNNGMERFFRKIRRNIRKTYRQFRCRKYTVTEWREDSTVSESGEQ